MSRSKKRRPFSSFTTAKSERFDKKNWHSRFRQATRQALSNGEDPPDFRELSNPWMMAKDGRYYMADPDERLLRK